MLAAQWLLPLRTPINGFYLLAVSVTPAGHLARLAMARCLTTAMNWLFLIAPFGMFLGIDGLWKVDREREAGIATS